VLQHFLQSDAIDARVCEIESIDAHLPEPTLDVRIQEPGNSDNLVAIIDAGHALFRKSPSCLMHKEAAITTDIDDRIALDAVENFRLAVAQGHWAEQRATLVGGEALAIHKIGFRGAHVGRAALGARGIFRRPRW
jgi:hypothetical protein